MIELHERLAAYQKQRKLSSKGKLAAILFVSRLAKRDGYRRANSRSS
jgi:hypothetical protein